MTIIKYNKLIETIKGLAGSTSTFFSGFLFV